MVAMRDRITGPDTRDMRDDALVRFTAHEIPREELHALMLRSDAPALRRAVWHLGMLILTGAVLWRLAWTAWAVPLIVVQGYMLAFIFCALHETAHRTAFGTRWINPVLGTLAGSECVSPHRRHPAAGLRPCGSPVDGAVGAAAAHHRSARLPGRVPHHCGGLDRVGAARAARGVDDSIDGCVGVPAAGTAPRAAGLR